MVLHALLIMSLLLLDLSLSHAAGPPWEVRPDGVGPLKIGMKPSAVVKLLGERIASPADLTSTDCFYVEPKNLEGLALMFDEGVLSRIDIRGRRRRTTTGISLGDSVSKIETTYGASLQREAHHYAETEHYLTVSSGRFAVRFETDEGKVGAIYVGFQDQVHYVEGCL